MWGKDIFPDVTDEILKFAKHKIKPQKTVEVPVFDFASKGE